MTAATPRRFPVILAGLLAIGVHVAIVASLPHAARPHFALPLPVQDAPVAAAALDLAPHAPAPQFQALAPAAAEAPKPAPAPARVSTTHTARVQAPRAAKTDQPATIDMRPHDDTQPIRIATPFPVTVVTPHAAP
jgi:hypothetical protein